MREWECKKEYECENECVSVIMRVSGSAILSVVKSTRVNAVVIVECTYPRECACVRV